MWARFNSTHTERMIIVKENRVKGGFQEQDIKILVRDMNAKVRNENDGLEIIKGNQRFGTRNENGRFLIQFCPNKKMMEGGTVFRHKVIHKKTWDSPDGRTKNQINNVMINTK